jgi:hypothetical protein
MTDIKCLRCNCELIEKGNYYLSDNGGKIKPPGSRHSSIPIKVFACDECGYIELKITSPPSNEIDFIQI